MLQVPLQYLIISFKEHVRKSFFKIFTDIDKHPAGPHAVEIEEKSPVISNS